MKSTHTLQLRKRPRTHDDVRFRPKHCEFLRKELTESVAAAKPDPTLKSIHIWLDLLEGSRSGAARIHGPATGCGRSIRTTRALGERPGKVVSKLKSAELLAAVISPALPASLAATFNSGAWNWWWTVVPALPLALLTWQRHFRPRLGADD